MFKQQLIKLDLDYNPLNCAMTFSWNTGKKKKKKQDISSSEENLISSQSCNDGIS